MMAKRWTKIECDAVDAAAKIIANGKTGFLRQVWYLKYHNGPLQHRSQTTVLRVLKARVKFLKEKR